MLPGRRRVALAWLAAWARRGAAGLAAVEFALVAPLLIVLFIGAVDAAQIFQTELQLAAAVSAGSVYAVVNQSSTNSTSGATLATTIAAIVGNTNGSGWASGTVVVNNGPTATFSGGTSTSSGTASNANSYYCPTGSPGSWNWGSALTSNTTACSSGSATAGKFVTITASRAFTPILVDLGFTAGTLSQSIAVQVQ
jgi:Flp pilus assembly protein TadG